MIVLIPAYEPDQRLLELIDQLQASQLRSIVIVDDGSRADYAPIFNAAKERGCAVLAHGRNLGKGRALKTGFHYLMTSGFAGGVVCADSDGQHLPADIIRIVRAIEENPGHIVLGSRQFTGKVPLRSRFGNSATRLVYLAATRTKIYDTQTGLRGFSTDMLHWLCSVPGDRFEYEMNMLLHVRSSNYSLVEVPIDTVYLDYNKSSHFRPLADSISVYKPIVAFSGSSLFAALLDYGLLLVLHALTGSLLLSVIGARACSSIMNYSMNRKFVFSDGKKSAVRQSLPKYFALVLTIMLLNYGLMYVLNESMDVPLLLSKLLTEGMLFMLSYWSQRKVVYSSAPRTAGCLPVTERADRY